MVKQEEQVSEVERETQQTRRCRRSIRKFSMPPPPSPAIADSLSVPAALASSGFDIYGRQAAPPPAGRSTLMSSNSPTSNEPNGINVTTTSFDRSPTPPFHAHEYPIFAPIKSSSNLESTVSKLSEDSLEALRDAEEDWLSPLVLDDSAHTHALDVASLHQTLYPPGQHAMSASAARLVRVNNQKPPGAAAASATTSASVTLLSRHKIESRPFHITSIHPNPAPMLPLRHKPRMRSAEFSRHGSVNPDWGNLPSQSSYPRKPLPQLLSDMKASKLVRNYSGTNTPSRPAPNSGSVAPPRPRHHSHPSGSLHHPPAHNAQFPASSGFPHRHPPEPLNASSCPMPNCCADSSPIAGCSDVGCMQSCDNCLPGSRMTVVPITTDSCELYTNDRPSPEQEPSPDSATNAKTHKPAKHPIILWLTSKKKPVMKGWRNQGAGAKGRAASNDVMTEKEIANLASMREKLLNLEEGKESLEMAMNSMKQEVSQANEKRDAALVEVFELKMAIEDMGKKLENLEGYYCQNMENAKRSTNRPLRNIVAIPSGANMPTGVREFGANGHNGMLHDTRASDGNNSQLYIGPSNKEFYHAVTEARVSVKQFCRTLLQQIQDQSATNEKIESILQPYNVKVAPRVSKSVRYHLESLINEAFYEDFENIKFKKSGTNCVLDPQQRSPAFYKTYLGMSQMGWSELVSKESSSYSESFDAFCDHKMNRVEQVLNWEGRWPDDLARSFFVAAKWVWLLHLLAFSFHHPALIFRVGSEAHYDSTYMEELLLEPAVSNAKLSTTTTVASHASSLMSIKAMVMPGFFFNNYEIIKCKVLLSK